jgi:hypothetical protein
LKKRLIVYIDGYNWYHAIFKRHPEWKWLNINSFFKALRPHEDVVAIKMFSALVVPTAEDPSARERQERYFRALRTLPGVEVILGVFQPREVQCRAVCLQRYTFQEEKKTDVNIAVEILSDAFQDRSDAICVVSGDSDVQPAIEWVARNKPQVGIYLYIPSLPSDQSARRLDYFKTKGFKGVSCSFLPLEAIPQHQLRNCVQLPDKTFAVRPHTWAAPTTGATT